MSIRHEGVNATRARGRWLLLISVVLFSCGVPGKLFGQLALHLSLKRSELLQFEAAPISLMIENLAGEPLVAARDVKDLPTVEFKFHRNTGKNVARLFKKPILRNMYIIAGKKETVKLDLTQLYDLSDMGQYIVKATVTWKGKTYVSNQVLLEIVRGVEIASELRRHPVHPERQIKYGVRYWRRDRKEHAFMVVDEENKGINYGVFDLGKVVRVSKPKIKIDAEGHITVIHQSGPQSFTHTRFQIGMGGMVLLGQTFHYANGARYPR